MYYKYMGSNVFHYHNTAYMTHKHSPVHIYGAIYTETAHVFARAELNFTAYSTILNGHRKTAIFTAQNS